MADSSDDSSSSGEAVVDEESPISVVVSASAVEDGGGVEDDDDEVEESSEQSPSLSSSASVSELAGSSGSGKVSMASVNSSAFVVNLLGSVIIMGFAFAISHAWKLRRERRGENKTSAKRLAARSSKNSADKKKVDDKEKEKAKAAEKEKEKAPPPAPVPKEANKPEPAAAAPPASAPKPAAPAAPKTATQTTAPKPAAPAAPKTATQAPDGVKKSCLFCGDDNPETHLLRCSVCKSVYFCSRACQRAAWPTHKAECNAKK